MHRRVHYFHSRKCSIVFVGSKRPAVSHIYIDFGIKITPNMKEFILHFAWNLKNMHHNEDERQQHR